jgi:hypothetical protein
LIAKCILSIVFSKKGELIVALPADHPRGALWKSFGARTNANTLKIKTALGLRKIISPFSPAVFSIQKL